MNKYLSFGGGVNSVALHLYLIDRGEKFESVFVHHDTDWPETYTYVAGFQWWLKLNGYRPITILRPKMFRQGRYFNSLIEYCEIQRMVPHFSVRWCTSQFKVKPMHDYIKKPATVFLGIDADEAKRAKIRVQAGVEDRWPLLEADIGREGCKQIIRAHGLPVPPKSGCYICPFMRLGQWKRLRREEPCLFRRVVDLEAKNIEYRKERGKNPMYLYQNRKATLPNVVDEKQRQIFEQDEYPPCQCGL